MKREELEEIAINKIKEWFGDLQFNYNVLFNDGDTCIVLTISDGYTAKYNQQDKNIALYRVFKTGDTIQFSEDIEYTCASSSETSLLACIFDIIKTYERIC